MATRPQCPGRVQLGTQVQEMLRHPGQELVGGIGPRRTEGVPTSVRWRGRDGQGAGGVAGMVTTGGCDGVTCPSRLKIPTDPAVGGTEPHPPWRTEQQGHGQTGTTRTHLTRDLRTLGETQKDEYRTEAWVAAVFVMRLDDNSQMLAVRQRTEQRHSDIEHREATAPRLRHDNQPRACHASLAKSLTHDPKVVACRRPAGWVLPWADGWGGGYGRVVTGDSVQTALAGELDA